MCRLFLVFCENFISLLPGTPKSARAPFLPKPGNKIRNHNRHDDKLPDPRPFLEGMGPAAYIADNCVDLPAVAGIHRGAAHRQAPLPPCCCVGTRTLRSRPALRSQTPAEPSQHPPVLGCSHRAYTRPPRRRSRGAGR